MKLPLAVTLLCFTYICSGMDTNYENNDSQGEIDNLSENITSRKAGQIRFEGQEAYSQVNDDMDHREPGNGFKFEDTSIDNGNRSPGQITFQDDNRIQNTGVKRKKRRRRKPKNQRLPNTNSPGLLPAGGLQYPPGFGPLRPHYPGVPGAVPPYHQRPVGAPARPIYRPPRRPKPSFASDALTAVTGALSSIALYDDYQCVPRLLCEAAGGGALGGASVESLGSAGGVLKAVAGLQPLLTLLSAYNGVSTSPLFVFGRAVFLGMTSKGNTASCRYAYPQCPADPEQLIHYLNNHNGGFFRFFNNPQGNPQNLEQFYHQLSLQGQNGLQNPQQQYGLYDPQSAQQYQNAPNQNQFQQQQYPQQQYGLYDPQSAQQHQNALNQNQFQQQQNSQQSFYDQQNQHGYGLQPFPGGQQNYGLNNLQSNRYPQENDLHNQQFQSYESQNPYMNPGYGFLQNYGPKYPYNNQYGLNANVRFKDRSNSNSSGKIQRRIQNRPNSEYVNTSVDSTRYDHKLKFPGSVREEIDNKEIPNEDFDNIEVVRGGKALKFPGENLNVNSQDKNYDRKVKSITFPEPLEEPNANANNKYQNNVYNQNIGADYQNNVIRDTALENYLKYYSYYHGNPVNTNINDNDEAIQTVYIVRGHGDPNMPEIVKIRSGEKVM